MTEFRSKDIRSTQTLGERLAEVRTDSRYTWADVSEATGIRQTYVQAIEEGRYADLPGDIYTKNFLRRYAEFLELNSESVLQLYEKEKGVGRPTQGDPSLLPRRRLSAHHFVITPKIIRRLGVALAILACFAYLGFEINQSISPPKLTIESPAENTITSELTIDVVGQVAGEAEVTVNGREIISDPNGRFRDTIALQDGVNIITIEAVKKRSKPTVVYRSVLRTNN